MARLTRAQSLPSVNKEVEVFSDFTTNFLKLPVGDQLARVTNTNSIKQSLKNLILTNTGERFFRPNLGGNIRSLLFENNSIENLTTAELYISRVIEVYEPRVQLLQTKITPSEQNENAVLITLVFRTLNNPEAQTFNIVLKRVR
jgi:phage baseplate assembly protein W